MLEKFSYLTVTEVGNEISLILAAKDGTREISQGGVSGCRL